MSKLKCEFQLDNKCGGKIKKRLSHFDLNKMINKNVCDRHFKDHLVLFCVSQKGDEKILKKFLAMSPEQRLKELSSLYKDPKKAMREVDQRYAFSNAVGIELKKYKNISKMSLEEIKDMSKRIEKLLPKKLKAK